MKIREYLKRFRNVGTVMSLVSLLGLLAMQFGFKVDMVWLDATMQLVCAIGLVLGVMNNPTNEGLDLPKIKGDK